MREIATLSPSTGERWMTRRPPVAALVAKIAPLGLGASLSLASALWLAVAINKAPIASRTTGPEKGTQKLIRFISIRELEFRFLDQRDSQAARYLSDQSSILRSRPSPHTGAIGFNRRKQRTQ